MHCFYRISDASYPKPKLPGCTKRFCLGNFTHAFWPEAATYTIIADRCGPETLAMVKKKVYWWKLHETDLGNAGSFRKALELAVELPADEVVYFVEDDYVHGRRALEAMKEAPADYWTLYDHPDKYEGPLEFTQVFKTFETHWRYTISTTMTFAARAGTLREDYDVWLRHTSGDHPNDHTAFCELGTRGRKLACPIPGRACHTDMTESLKAGRLLFDWWVYHTIMDEYCGLAWIVDDEYNEWMEKVHDAAERHTRNDDKILKLLEEAMTWRQPYWDRAENRTDPPR
jgi:hypothetical protein